jgi:hypothetical protein
MSLRTESPPSEIEEHGLDRRLGDEWLDWRGQVEKGGGEIRQGKGLFLVLSALAVAVGTLIALLFWFLISPRLALSGTRIHGAGRALVIGILAAFLGWYALTLLSVLLERRVLLGHGARQRLVNLIVPWAVRLGRLLGFSRDRVSNSFVKVSNALGRAAVRRVSPGDLLLLLPRCLTGEVRAVVLELGRAYGCRIATASGGSVARLQIERMKPGAIITMACERDLVSGIQDVAPEIPVIAIPNRRPRGPCKNTEVDPGEVESAIRLYLGRDGPSGSAGGSG